ELTGNAIHDLAGNGLQGGTFQPQQSKAVGTDPYFSVVADLNGDGKLDIATANYNNTVSVLLGNGDGTFAAQQTFPTGQIGAQDIAVGDLNGDGKLDLVTANFYSNSVSVLLGNGNGTFQTAQAFAAQTQAYA